MEIVVEERQWVSNSRIEHQSKLISTSHKNWTIYSICQILQSNTAHLSNQLPFHPISNPLIHTMEVEAICDNCSNKNLQLLGANKEFFLAKCDHVLYFPNSTTKS